MSLLDDVSIVVTPNGYKAGELYAVVPEPTEGAELVTNGEFATDTDWTKQTGWTISGGTANYDFLSDAKYIRQTLLSGGFVVGKTYKINFEVTSGSAYMYFNSNGGSLISIATYEIGSYSIEVSPANNGSDILIYGRNTSGTAFSIDNVSVKEYTSADMDVTRATAATRVDENGLVNYAEIVGGEEVTNSDFATDSDWTKGIGITISGGKANFINSTGDLRQDPVVENGKYYKVTYTISDYVSGSVRFEIPSNIGSGIERSANGTYTEILLSSGTAIQFDGRTAFTGSIDNVSVKEVTRDNVPRIDYTGGGCPHILAEPQRTNLVTYSEDFSESSWLRQNLTVELNSAVSPSGDSDASKLVEDSSNTTHRILTSAGLTISGDVSISVFAKKGERNWIKLLNNNLVGAFFDLENGVIGSVGGGIDAKIENYGNGWYRCSFTATAVANERIGIYTSIDGINLTYQGDGESGVYVYGATIEVGSYPTSYIPTSGSTVTRNQDIFTRDGIGSLINSTEGVLFAEMAFSDAGRLAILNSDASDDQVVLGFSGTVFCRIRENGANVVTQFVSSANQLNTYYKIAVKYKSGSSAIWVDGNETVVAGTFTLNDLSKILFISEGSRAYGKVKQLQVYKTALTDVQLAALTS